MRHHIPVSNIMTKQVVTLTSNDDLEHAEKLFKEHNIRHMPVVHDETVIGMLSYTDLMRISQAEVSNTDDQSIDSIVYNMFTIEQVMVKDVVTVNSKTSIKRVAEILSEREFHALPIVDNGVLVGIVTTTDLLQYFLKLG